MSKFEVTLRVLAALWIAATIAEIHILQAKVARLEARVDGNDIRMDAIETRAAELKESHDGNKAAIETALSFSIQAFSIQAFCTYRPAVCDRLKINYAKETK